MTTNDNFQRLTKMPKSIKQIFPASSVAVVLGGHKSWDTYAHLEGDAWIVANADGMRLAITGRGRFIQLDGDAAKRLISALTEALELHKLAGGPAERSRYSSVRNPTALTGAETWAVGREVAEKIRSLPAPCPGRPKPEETMPDVHARCLELAADGERPKSIHYRLIQEFGRDNVPKDSRTVRRWLEKVRADVS